MGFSWWVTELLTLGGPPLLVSWIVIIIGSIVLHELGHGWAALAFGDDTPRLTGHMTWNPVVHLGLPSLLCFAAFGFAWGAMPVNSNRLRGRNSFALVCLAGPGMNLALSAAALVMGALWERFGAAAGPNLYPNFTMFFGLAATLNLFCMFFNLLPIYPLDGGRIAAELSRTYREFAESEHGGWVMWGGFLLFFWYGADVLFPIARAATASARDALSLLLAMI